MRQINSRQEQKQKEIAAVAAAARLEAQEREKLALPVGPSRWGIKRSREHDAGMLQYGGTDV